LVLNVNQDDISQAQMAEQPGSGVATRTAEFWALEGVPLLGISGSAVLGMSLDQLLRDRFSRFSVIHRLQASYLEEFQLLPTFSSPHFTVRLQQANEEELSRLLAALGDRAHHRGTRSSAYRQAAVLGPPSARPGTT
jgi:hypothetical protein